MKAVINQIHKTHVESYIRNAYQIPKGNLVDYNTFVRRVADWLRPNESTYERCDWPKLGAMW